MRTSLRVPTPRHDARRSESRAPRTRGGGQRCECAAGRCRTWAPAPGSETARCDPSARCHGPESCNRSGLPAKERRGPQPRPRNPLPEEHVLRGHGRRRSSRDAVPIGRSAGKDQLHRSASAGTQRMSLKQCARGCRSARLPLPGTQAFGASQPRIALLVGVLYGLPASRFARSGKRARHARAGRDALSRSRCHARVHREGR